jgi:hypothetical protein
MELEMKQIVAWVPEDKKEKLIKENEKFNIPMIFVNSIPEIEKNLDGFAIFYPSLVVNNNDFVSLIKKYPARTFNPICDFYAMDFKTTMFMESLNDLIPDNPNIAKSLLLRFLEMKVG